MSLRMLMSSGGGKGYTSTCSSSAVKSSPCQLDLRAFEGIKNKLELLSGRSSDTEHGEKEEDVIAVCDLADDLRDVIVEYQVSNIAEKHIPDSWLILLVVLATEGDLQAKL